MSLSVRRSVERANPVPAAGWTVTGESEVIAITLPRAQLLWHRPTAVIVEREGQARRSAIVDITRIALLAILAVTGIAFFAWLRRMRSA